MGPLGAASPAYVEIVTDINGDIAKIQNFITELQRAHEARLRIVLEPADMVDREINLLTDNIKGLFNNATRKLKRVQAYKDGVSESELRVRNNVQRGLATKLHDLSRAFQSMQKQYIASVQRVQASGSISALLGGGAAAADRDEGFTDEQMHELATAEEDVDERMREIQRIAKSVEELADLFKELSVMIVDQGTLLDRIDHNMEQAVQATQQGVKELKKAEEYQKSARPIMCMGILMVLIIICVVIIIIKAST